MKLIYILFLLYAFYPELTTAPRKRGYYARYYSDVKTDNHNVDWFKERRSEVNLIKKFFTDFRYAPYGREWEYLEEEVSHKMSLFRHMRNGKDVVISINFKIPKTADVGSLMDDDVFTYFLNLINEPGTVSQIIVNAQVVINEPESRRRLDMSFDSSSCQNQRNMCGFIIHALNQIDWMLCS